MKRLLCISLVTFCLIGCGKKAVIKGTAQPTSQATIKPKYVYGCLVVKGPREQGNFDLYLVQRNGVLVCARICNIDGSFCDFVPGSWYDDDKKDNPDEMKNFIDNTIPPAWKK